MPRRMTGGKQAIRQALGNMQEFQADSKASALRNGDEEAFPCGLWNCSGHSPITVLFGARRRFGLCLAPEPASDVCAEDKHAPK